MVDPSAVPNNGGMWDPVNLTKGASITKPLGFQATAGHPAGAHPPPCGCPRPPAGRELVLVWTPNMFISGDHNIPLN
jgi:hypothetical protein